MRDDELTALLRSPALALEPLPDLAGTAVAGARRVQRRRTAGTVALSVLAVAVATLTGPGLVRGLTTPPVDPPDRVASDLSALFPDATSDVELLEAVNGGRVVTWFEDRRWCTAAVRTGTADGCSRALGVNVPPFAFVRRPGDERVTVDRDGVVAGVLGTDAVRVEVALSDGSTPVVSQTSARGFPRPVWWTPVPAGVTVERLTAYDAAGSVVGTG